MVDANSDNRGAQRFEKAISGMYLGEIFKTAFPLDEFEEKFDAQRLTTMLSYPAAYKEDYVRTARWLYERSAQLVAASLVGLILVLISHDTSVKKVLLTAEGSLFWSKNRKGHNYKDMVTYEVHHLLKEFGHHDVTVEILQMENANLIGTAVAALS
jgi:hexokinase